MVQAWYSAVSRGGGSDNANMAVPASRMAWNGLEEP